MSMKENVMTKIYAGGFLFNPKNTTMLLHLRDGNTAHNPHRWSFFGGCAERGESPEACFIREIKEELGIDIATEEIQSVCDYWIEELHTWRYVFCVESDFDKKDMILGEGAGFDWIPADKIFSYDLTDRVRNDLGTFLSVKEKI